MLPSMEKEWLVPGLDVMDVDTEACCKRGEDGPRGSSMEEDCLVPGLDVMDVDTDAEDEVETAVVASVVKGAVEFADISGSIDGVPHTAACGLHALWGRCNQSGASLYATRAWEFLQSSILGTASRNFANFKEVFSIDLPMALLRSVFDDQVMPVAETITSHGNMDGCPQWRRAVWATLPPLIQQDCPDFVAEKASKRKEVHGIITPELVSFARDFFVPCHGASLIRPLCLMLDFVCVEDGVELRAGGWQEAKHNSKVPCKGLSCCIRGSSHQA